MQKQDYPLVVIGGPSGSGKDSLITEALVHYHPRLTLGKIITTRPPRLMETGAYRFVTKEEFLGLLSNGELIEHALFSGHLYGRLWSDLVCNGCMITQEIWGFETLAQKLERIVTIFIAPPSLDVLRQRLRDRGTETAESLRQRLVSAEQEMQRIGFYSHCIVNDQYEDAKQKLFAILDSLVS